MAGNLAPTNILALAQYVDQQGDLGRQQGTQQRFNRLAGQAYTAPAGESRLALLGQAVQTDPTAGMALGNQLAATDQAAATDHMKKLGGAARYMAQALQSKNPAQVEGAWQAVRPYLAQLTGKEPPPQWDPAMEPALYQAIAATGGGMQSGQPAGFQQFELTARAAGLQPGSPEYQQAANIALGREGRASNAGIGFQKVTGADGRERIGRSNPRTGEFEVYNEQTGQFEPMGGAQIGSPSAGQLRPAVGVEQPAPPAGDPMQPIIERANQMAAQGVPDDQVRAWMMQQAQSAGLGPRAASGNQLQNTQGVAPGQLGVSRSPEETAAAVEAAKQQASLQFLPQTEAIKANAAIQQAGGTAAAKNAVEKQANMPKNRAAVIASGAELDRLAAAAQEVLDSGGLGRITGIAGVFPNMPGGEAANTQAKLDQLKSQVGFSVLQNMRDNSPTGGALGQVSDRENEMLQNNLAALGRAQSEEQYRTQLQKIINYAHDSKARRMQAFQATYDGTGQNAPAQQPQSSADGDFSSLWGN